MPAQAGQVPILESVRAGYAFVAGHWRALLMPAIAGSLALVLVSAIGGSMAGQAGGVILAVMLQLLVVGATYAAFLAIAIKGESWRAGVAGDAARLIAAMAIVGFFLFLLFMVALIPGAIALGAVFEPYRDEMVAAQNDPIAMNALATRMFQENPAPTLVLTTLYAAAWMTLTSRLFLVAPATVAENAMRTFETWPWTKGSMLRIAAARIMLLWPATLALFLVQSAATQAVQGGMAALALPAVLLISIATMALYALEAGLSAYLYRGLKPQA